MTQCSTKPAWRRLGLIALLATACSIAAPVYAAGTVLVFGDSLSAGHGLTADEGWVALLRERLATRDADIDVVNASVSGETTAGGRARLPAALARVEPDIVVLELGGNDGLRALPVAAMQDNLEAMIAACRARDAKVLLLGMRIPSNYGARYSERFAQAFADVASTTDVAFIPFFLRSIANNRDNFQADGIHPNAAAQDALLAAVWPKLAKLMAPISPVPASP